MKKGWSMREKESVMREMKGCGKLDDTVAFMQTLLEPSAYVGMGKGTNLVTAPFRMEEGVQQGAVESGWLFSLGANPAFQRCNRMLAEHGGALTAIIDDNYINGPPAQAFEANRMLAEDLKEVGLELQPAKSKCHIDAAHRDDEWERVRGDIPNGVLKTAADEVVLVDGSPVYGMTVCNVPTGSQEFVEGYLGQRLEKIQKGYTKLGDLLDPGRWPNPDIPTRQMLWILTVTCLQFMGDYWMRHVRPDLTEKFARGIDEGINAIFRRCIGVNTESWSDIAKERLRLPIRLKGCGLREAEDRRFGQYLGATAQSVIQLIDRMDDSGNRIAGRLHTPAIATLFGEGSFNHPFTAPWATLLANSRPGSNIATGLQQAWSHLTLKFQEVVLPEQVIDSTKHLLTQPVARAGFYEDGTMAKSVTSAITIELEKQRLVRMSSIVESSLGRDDYEKWAWDGCSNLSAAFLQSPLTG